MNYDGDHTCLDSDGLLRRIIMTHEDADTIRKTWNETRPAPAVEEALKA
jgi:hypothetical protein